MASSTILSRDALMPLNVMAAPQVRLPRFSFTPGLFRSRCRRLVGTRCVRARSNFGRGGSSLRCMRHRRLQPDAQVALVSRRLGIPIERPEALPVHLRQRSTRAAYKGVLLLPCLGVLEPCNSEGDSRTAAVSMGSDEVAVQDILCRDDGDQRER